jgi:hypothetical protein
MSLKGLGLLLELKEGIDLKLGPYKVGFLGVLLDRPPKPSLEQTLNEQIVVALAKVEPILALCLQRSVVFEDERVEDSMG